MGQLAGAGFTSGEPWLPVAASAARGVNAADERDDPRSLLSLYRRLLWYRRGVPALRHGDYRPLDAPDGSGRTSARPATSGCWWC